MIPESNVILGLDIGSSKIAAVICELDASGELNLKGMGTSITAGIERGRIVNTEDLSRAIERAVKRAQRMAEIVPVKVITNVPFFGMQFIHNSGFLLSKDASGKISEEDKREVIRRSKNISVHPDSTIMHVFPLYYKVEDTITSQPVNSFGSHLEVYTHLIMGHSTTINRLIEALRTLNLQISGMVYDPLAASQVYLTSDERKKGTLFIDIGGRFTKVSFFKNAVLYHSFVIPIGSDTFTADVAECLSVTMPEAERLKIVYGDVILSRVDPEQSILITSDKERKSIKVFYLCRILEARAAELVKMITRQLPFDLDPSFGIVLGGGGFQLSGLTDYFRTAFMISIRDGLPDNIKGIIESYSYASAVGLILYGLKTGVIAYNADQKKSLVRRFFKKVRDIF